MKYTTFRTLAVATGVVLVGGMAYTCGRQSSPPRDLPAAPMRVAKAPAALPAVAKPATVGQDYRRYLLETLGKPASGDKLKDALTGPAKVNVYASKGLWTRAKVDLNRNDKWEEKWWLDGTRILRQVAPNDDEQYGPETEEGALAR